MYCQSPYSSHSSPNIGRSLQPFEQAIFERRVSRLSLRAPLVLTSCSTNNNEQQPITSNQPHRHTATHTNADTNKHTTHHHQTHHTRTRTRTHAHAHAHACITTTSTTTTSVTSWVQTLSVYQGCVFGPFSLGRYTQGAFLLPETASAFLSTMFPHIRVPSSVPGLCQIRRVACCAQ